MMPLLACSTQGASDPADSLGGLSGLTADGASGSATDGTDSNGAPTSGDGDGSGDDAADSGPGGPKFDVGTGNYCATKAAGIYCDGNIATECGNANDVVSTETCTPEICLEGTGCVECLAGQHDCQGDKVMACNALVVPPVWEVVEVCDPTAGQGCDLALGGCAVLQPVGGVAPTGNYYQYADFHTGATAFLGGYDVGSWDDRLYVTSLAGNAIDIYQVQLLDSDGDGKLEPNQHPDNPEMPGVIEERVLTFVETMTSWAPTTPSASEVHAFGDRLYLGGGQLTEYLMGGGGSSLVTTAPGWAPSFAQLGYDDVNDVWYASNESYRRVMQYDASTDSWGIAFLYPELAGDHMDGLEVVTDPNTGIPYVYVSDMTSDFIGQYRLDPELGWIQQNLFSYEGTAGAPVEGMGYGALNHFWATAGSSLYEVGGGDLADFTEPPK